ncbi:MAG: ROK family protein [Geminicoccaceae bacterium]|nr:MAG: ROK family protein [Geminicoccaceae bacterium]
MGIDLGGTKSEVIVLDRAGAELRRRRVPSPRGDYRATIETIAGLVDWAEEEVAATCSVGVGHPGSLSPASGLIRNANSTWLNGQPFGRDLEARLGRRVAMANDADCLALSEATDGAGAGATSVFAVIIGTGTGGGLVLDGKLIRGANGIAGEWGHNALPWPTADEFPGPGCWCGKHGCIETWLSGTGLGRAASEALGRPLTGAEVADAAMAGDPDALGQMYAYAERFAKASATVLNLFDPEVVVLGGGVSNVPLLYELIPPAWQRWVFADAITTRLARAQHGDSSGVRGAAWLGRTRAS